MRYYRRYHADGRCAVVCTRCLATVGRAATFTDADELEKQHVCGPRARVEFGDAALRFYAEFGKPRAWHGGGLRDFLGGLSRLRAWMLFAAIILVVYGLPNLVEFAIQGAVSPWVLNILFGDLTGCVLLAAVLRMPRTGVLLYVSLSLAEAGLYATGTVSPSARAWMTDAVPTLVVVGRVVQLRPRARLARG